MQKEIARDKINYYSIGRQIKYYPSRSQIEIKTQSKRLSGFPKKILDCILKNYPEETSKKDIIATVWRTGEGSIQALNTHLSVLRNLLEDERTKDKSSNENQTQWKIIDKASTGCLAIKPDVTAHHFQKLVPTPHKTVVSVIGTAVLLLFISLFSFRFIPASPITTSQTLISVLKGEFERAASSPEGNIFVYTYKSPGSSSWNLIASDRKTGKINWLITEDKPNTYNTAPNFSPSGEQLTWLHTDYQTFCHIYVANFDKSKLAIGNKKSVFQCKVPQLARSPNFKTETSLLFSLSDFQTPYRIIELDLWTGKQTLITQPKRSSYGDYSLFYLSDNNAMAYFRQIPNTGIELRLYNFDERHDLLLKEYPYWLTTIAWLNKNELVAQSDRGYEVVSISETNSVSLIGLPTNEPLHHPFTVGQNSIGFVKGSLVDRDIIITNMNNGSVNTRLSTKWNDYLAVIAGNQHAIVYLSLENQKHQLYYATENSRNPIVELDLNATILDLAISPDGQTIAYQNGSKLVVVNNKGTILYTETAEISGFTFSEDSNYLFVARFDNDNETSVIKLSIQEKFQENFIAHGLMPKTDQDKLYFMRKQNEEDKTWLYQYSNNKAKKIMPTPFSTMRFSSNSFDIINNYLYYIEKGYLVKLDLISRKKTQVTQIESRTFSINHTEDVLVSTKKSPVQNNLILLELAE